MWTTAKTMLRSSYVALSVYIRKAYSSKNQKNLKTKNQTQKKVEGSKYKKQKINIQQKKINKAKVL